MNKYNVFHRGEGPVTYLVDGLPTFMTAWIAYPNGWFLAAFATYTEAQAVAGALNAAEEFLSKLERLAAK